MKAAAAHTVFAAILIGSLATHERASDPLVGSGVELGRLLCELQTRMAGVCVSVDQPAVWSGRLWYLKRPAVRSQ